MNFRHRSLCGFLSALTFYCFSCGPSSAADPILKTGSNHPVQYYLSLPKDWSPSLKWPLVITLDGVGRSWLGNAQQFAKARDQKDLPFIIATPAITTNAGRDNIRVSPLYHYAPSVFDQIDREGRCSFDVSALETVVADVVKEYHADPKYFLTGWSAGGHLGWAMVFLHPEKLRAAAMSGPNYAGLCINFREDPPKPFSKAIERIDLPVTVFRGELEDAMIDPGIRNAMDMAALNGFRHVSKVVVPNTPHLPMAPQVLDYFYSIYRR